MSKRMRKALDKIEQQMVDAEDAVIAEYRAKYVVPYCDKHRLRFLAGMGGWVIADAKGNHYGGEYDERRVPKRLRDILDMEVAQHDYGAGAIMEDYTSPGYAEDAGQQ